jgi:hypothetical protein
VFRKSWSTVIRVLDSYNAVLRQIRIVAAILIGSTIAAARGAAWAPATALGAAFALLALGIGAAMLAGHKRDRAIDLILDGRDGPAGNEVQRQLRRLLSERTRGALATTLEQMVADASHRRQIPVRSARPPVDAAVITAAAAGLREVARLLRAGDPTARGVAFAERLVTGVDSPLYGHDAGALHETARRIARMLDR